eukprot:3910681-Rhodomonas_salina.2
MDPYHGITADVCRLLLLTHTSVRLSTVPSRLDAIHYCILACRPTRTTTRTTTQETTFGYPWYTEPTSGYGHTRYY